METWKIYKSEYVYTRKAGGNCYKNSRTLEQIAEVAGTFSSDCWPIIEKTKKELCAAGAWESHCSRGNMWCVDLLNRKATEADEVLDDMFPSIIGIEIITTPYTLTLKETNK